MTSLPTEDCARQFTPQASEAASHLNEMGMVCLGTLPRDGNIVLSPYAVANVAMILYQGSVGETRRAVATATHYSSSVTGLSDLFRQLAVQLMNNPEGTHDFDLANIVLVGGACDTKPEVARYLAECLHGRTEHVPDQLYRIQCSDKLRRWAMHVTRGELDYSVDVECDSEAPVVVASAVYFRGCNPLHVTPKRTTVESFRNIGSVDSLVAMMHARGVYSYVYSRQLRAQAVRVPFDSDLSLLLLLPSQPKDIRDLEHSMDSKLLSLLAERMRNMLVDVRLPRFCIQHATSLRGFLTKLGLGCLFSTVGPAPDFSGLHGRPGVPLGNVFQLLRFLVDESSLGLGLGECVFTCRALLADRRPPIHFHAGHPFLFYVLHSSSEAILLMGRVLLL